MPYANDNYTLPSVDIDWPTNGAPILTWTAPAQEPDHFVAFISNSPNFGTATRDGTTGGSASSYTFSSAQNNGQPYFFWVIGMNADETQAGTNGGAAGWQLAQTIELSNDLDGHASFSFNIPMDTVEDAHFRSECTVSFSSVTVTVPANCPPGPPWIARTDQGEIEVLQQGTPVGGHNEIGNQSGALTDITWMCDPTNPEIAVPGPGGSATSQPDPPPDPVKVLNSAFNINGPNVLGINFVQATDNNLGSFDGIMGVIAVSYFSGGSAKVQQAPPPNFPPLPPPPPPPPPVPHPLPPIGAVNGTLPTPLPCIPCCSTAAPICSWPS